MYGMFKSRKYSLKIEDLSDRINLILPEDLKGTVDIHFDGDESTSVLPLGTTGSLSILGKEYDKGYDLLLVSHDKSDSVFPMHSHKRANTLFYILEGEVEFHSCGLRYLREECSDTCPYIKRLKKGDLVYVEKNKYHKIKAITPTKYIVIAKPSIFSRIGNKYESLFKK